MPDAFWELIVPKARLDKGRRELDQGAHVAQPQINHAENPNNTKPVVCKEEGAPHLITTANATNPYAYLGRAPKDMTSVKRRAERRPGSGIRERPAYSYISLAEQLKRTQPAETNKYVDDGRLSEDEGFAPIPALHKGDENEESSEGLDSTEGSDGDEDYVESDDEDYSESDSDASRPVAQVSQPLGDGTPRRASTRARESRAKGVKKPSQATAPKQKSALPQAASAKDRGPAKRVRLVVDGTEYSDEEDDGEAMDRSVFHRVNRPAKGYARGQRLSSLPAPRPLSRQHKRWTNNEEETLFNLRNRGKSWIYIGERVLGRTAASCMRHWDYMRFESLQPAEARAKKGHPRQNSSIVSVMSQTPKMNTPWSPKELGILVSLRARGKTLSYACGRLPGRGYSACKLQWHKIKDQYPQAVMASKNLESGRNGGPSDDQDAPVSFASQLGQVAEETGSDSCSAIIERDDPRSSTMSDPAIDANVVITPSAKRSYKDDVASHAGLPSGVASKRSKTSATLSDHHNQQAAKPLAVGERTSALSHGSVYSDQPYYQLNIARTEPEAKKEGPYREDLLLVARRQTRRRSYSWPY